MAVGDVFKKRRNLVQSAASKPRAGYGARVNAFKVEPTGNPMRDWAEAERAATGSINRMQPGQAGQAWGQAQRDWAEQERGATLGWGEQPATRQADVFQLTGNAGMTGAYRQNQPVYFQGVDPRTGQVSRVPISHKQMSAFNNPFLGSGDMGRPEDGSIAPVAGGPRSFNPQNQGPVLPYHDPRQREGDPVKVIKRARSFGQPFLWGDDSVSVLNKQQDAAELNREAEAQARSAERTEWDALGDLNAEDPSWVLRRRAERTLGDQVRGMMDQNSQEPRAFNPQNQGPVLPYHDPRQREGDPVKVIKRARSFGQPFLWGDDSVSVLNKQQDAAELNQDVLARASAALDAVKQDRLNPMGGQGSPGLRGFVDSVGSGFRSLVSGLREVGQSAMGGPVGGRYMIAPPAISNPMNTELAPVYDPQAAAMDSLRAKIDARVTQSQQDNPMVPRQPYDPMQEGIVQGRRQDQFMSNARIAGSSGEAGVTARSIPGDLYNPITARPANRYDGVVQSDRDQTRMTPNEKLELAERSAGRYMQGGAAADPTNMRGRFGGTALDEYNATGMSWQDRERAAEFAADAPNRDRAQRVMLQKRAEREAARAADPAGEAVRLQRIADATAARKAKHEEFKANNGGMNYGQARRAERQTGLKQRSYDKAIIKGMNPFGPEAQARFPDQVSAAKGGQNQAGPNPLTAVQEALRPGGVITPDSQAKGRSMYSTVVKGGVTPDGTKVDPSPLFAGMGLTGDEDNIQDLHFGLQEAVQELPEGADLSDNDLQQLYAGVAGMQAGHSRKDYDPFDMTYGYEGISGGDKQHTEVFSPMYKELAGMKSPTPEKLREWWGRFKPRIAPKAPWFGFGAMPGVSETIGGYEYPLPANPMK